MRKNSSYLVVRYGVQYNGSSKCEMPNYVLTGCLHPTLPAVGVYLQRHCGCDMSFSHTLCYLVGSPFRPRDCS
jgi:hypothetical protein